MQIQCSYEPTFVQQKTLGAENPVFEIVQESVKVCTTGMSSRTLYGQHPVSLKIFTSLPGSRLCFFYHDANSVPLVAHLCTAVLIRFMRRTLCSKLFSSTIFDPDANPVLLRAHLCTAVDSMRRKPCVQNCSRKREGLYNGNVQQNPLCAASCVTKDIHISPRFSPAFFYRDVNSVLLVAHLCTAVLIRSMRRTLSSKLFMMRA